jgi:hypothetical protein
VRIRTIHLDDKERPSSVVAEMTIEEAAQIAKWAGSLSPDTGMTGETSELYGSLVGSVFNRFWSDGVDGYRRGDDE